MKSLYREILLAALLGLVLPWGMLNLVIGLDRAEPVASVGAVEMETAPEVTAAGESLTMLLRREDGQTQELDMDTYLTGVLLAEVPASFHPEAKKAQAVAARTFTRKAWVTGGKHGDGSVCTDPACCQAYIEPQKYLENGGTEEAVEQARAAAVDTAGYVLTYDGALIESTYFSCSGGSTEDAVAVWGADYPYLRGTQSPGEENAAHYIDTVRFTKSEFAKALDVTLTGEPDSWIGFTTYTSGGGVNTMRIAGQEFQGTELRKLLGLRSTAFTVTADGEGVTITTRGYGHRVGMSQYGADAMAESGSTYAEILVHYYQGTQLEVCVD